MSWKDQFIRASKVIREVAESETAQALTAKARTHAVELAEKARSGAMDAAQSFVSANSNPGALNIQYQNARISVVSPSDGFEFARPNPDTLIISDGENNGLVINASAERPYVIEQIGKATRLSENTYDLGAVDGVNVVVLDV